MTDTTEQMVKRLRARSRPIMASAGLYEYQVNSEPDALSHEAADELTRLQSENAVKDARIKELVEGLRPFAEYRATAIAYVAGSDVYTITVNKGGIAPKSQHLRTARSLLEKEG